MTVVVSWVTSRGTGYATAIGRVTAQERVTVPGTTARATLQNEMAVVGNGETSMVAVAWGSTPDAAATSETALTSAGVAVPAGGLSYPLDPKVGDKINVKVVT
jgi:hypothetical protein